MSSIKPFSIRSMIDLAVTYLLILVCALPVAAQDKDSHFLFLLGSGFLCEPDEVSVCPAMAKSDQGDSYEMSGAGTFEMQSKSVRAAGAYTHKSPNGNVLETGVWLADELLSFNSYGTAPNALPRSALASGPQLLALKHLPMPRRPIPTGGLAVLHVRLLPLRGPSRTAVLQMNCALGDVPRERSVEGIRLNIKGNARDFSEEGGGRVMFLSTKMSGDSP